MKFEIVINGIGNFKGVVPEWIVLLIFICLFSILCFDIIKYCFKLLNKKKIHNFNGNFFPKPNLNIPMPKVKRPMEPPPPPPPVLSDFRNYSDYKKACEDYNNNFIKTPLPTGPK